MKLNQFSAAALAAVTLGVLTALAGVGAGFAQAPPPEAYARNPEMRFPRISPDGTKLAWIDNRDGQQTAIIGRFGDGAFAIEKRIGLNQLKTRGLRWAGETHVLITTSDTREFKDTHLFNFRSAGRTFEFFRTHAINIDTAGVTLLLDSDKDRTLWVNINLATISSPHYKKPGHVLMPAYVGNTSQTGSRLADTDVRRQLLEVNLDTGRRTNNVERGDPTTSYYIADSEGPVAQVRYDDASDHFMVLKRTGKTWSAVVDMYTDLPEIDVVGYAGSADRPVLMIKQGGQYKLVTAESDGVFHDFYVAPDGLDVNGAQIDPYTSEVIGATYTDDTSRLVYFDDELQGIYSQIHEALPGSVITLASWDRARNRFVINVEPSDSPPVHFLLDRSAGQLSKLGAEYPELTPEWVGATRYLTYDARDGMSIPAYLTLPPTGAATNLPLVVLPHGGPESQTTGDFNWLSQFVASRGYAVLQPNFRGSSGYGEAFAHAGYGQWGKAMQNDLSDGVQHLVDQGIADPARVCIFGWSYGGYAALAGATLTPDLYRCAIAGAPVSDLPAMIAHEEQRYGKDGATVAYWTRNILDGGRLTSGDVANVSPARLADNVQAPILILHGTNDTVVPYAQTELMENALKRAGKPHKVVTLDFADHWLTGGTPETVKLTVLQEVETFLDANLN